MEPEHHHQLHLLSLLPWGGVHHLPLLPLLLSLHHHHLHHPHPPLHPEEDHLRGTSTIAQAAPTKEKKVNLGWMDGISDAC